MKSDADRLEELLRQGPMTQAEILEACRVRGWPRMTVHSRAADLRARGLTVTCEHVGVMRGRPQHRYTLVLPVVRTPHLHAVPEPEEDAFIAPPSRRLVSPIRGAAVTRDDLLLAKHVREGGHVRLSAGGVERL